MWPLTVVGKGSAILELLSSKDQSLLVRGDTLLVLDLGFDIVDGVGRLHLEGDGLTRKAGMSVYPSLSLLASVLTSLRKSAWLQPVQFGVLG
jgi:hypothetical protein